MQEHAEQHKASNAGARGQEKWDVSQHSWLSEAVHGWHSVDVRREQFTCPSSDSSRKLYVHVRERLHAHTEFPAGSLQQPGSQWCSLLAQPFIQGSLWSELCWALWFSFQQLLYRCAPVPGWMSMVGPTQALLQRPLLVFPRCGSALEMLLVMVTFLLGEFKHKGVRFLLAQALWVMGLDNSLHPLCRQIPYGKQEWLFL